MITQSNSISDQIKIKTVNLIQKSKLTSELKNNVQ